MQLESLSKDPLRYCIPCNWFIRGTKHVSAGWTSEIYGQKIPANERVTRVCLGTLELIPVLNGLIYVLDKSFVRYYLTRKPKVPFEPPLELPPQAANLTPHTEIINETIEEIFYVPPAASNKTAIRVAALGLISLTGFMLWRFLPPDCEVSVYSKIKRYFFPPPEPSGFLSPEIAFVIFLEILGQIALIL